MSVNYKQICKDVCEILNMQKFFNTEHKFSNIFYDSKNLNKLSKDQVLNLYKDLIISWSIITTRNQDPDLTLDKSNMIQRIKFYISEDGYKILYEWIINYIKKPSSYPKSMKKYWTSKNIKNYFNKY